jgi:hypothetical protein
MLKQVGERPTASGQKWGERVYSTKIQLLLDIVDWVLDIVLPRQTKSLAESQTTWRGDVLCGDLERFS